MSTRRIAADQFSVEWGLVDGNPRRGPPGPASFRELATTLVDPQPIPAPEQAKVAEPTGLPRQVPWTIPTGRWSSGSPS